MFESVAPETFQTRSKRLMYETLPLSIALHLIVIAAVMASTLWTVVFPEQTPRLVRAYFLSSIPDPPPPPPPPSPAAPQPLMPPPAQLMVLAPTKIPDLIPTLDPPAPVVPPPVLPVVAEIAPAGDPAGQTGGEIGGKLHGIPGGVVFPEDGRVHIDRNEQLPLVVVSQDYPKYPDDARKKQLEDQVIVRYVIGKDGRVIDIQIIDHAQTPSFDEAVLTAIRNWRFRPMIRDGKKTEVVHELAVNFELIRH